MPQLALAVAIVCEVIATAALKSSDGFTRLWPSLAVIAGYGLAFYALSLALRAIPVGVAYAIWSGVGIVGIALIGRVVFRQTLDAPALIGIGLILAGVLVLNLFSASVKGTG
ncbi:MULTISPECIES: multidrug efflux SMR transporter [unclassified Elioraea]|jgi:small multidrug resistance pump|uniref:DMT family transporter n=1 Tax=unclassified Elioraea TaxID=2619524 RepID=UPI0011505BED|nr:MULTISPECIES: multidrug efflux SMR transporter [unclassified Elioraea]TQF77966.1 multidrug efflux SMR transporter [Elioraea sp. Yellowstone]GIX08325.1 MAG: multidrug transporter [Elioraea sp.]